ncbi:MAG: hypothetical protein KDB21_12360 [Acidimicrobiales bacterium]|nr:hypothetical protein [Acidimicrobiales bacterium]
MAQLRAVVDQLRLVGALVVEVNDELIAAERRYVAAVLDPHGEPRSLPAARRN